jgi:sigma-B regulation protein RsbU (phosphoserine phosphatase)
MQVEPSARLAVAWTWVKSSFAGRTLAIGAAIKIVALLLRVGRQGSGLAGAFDTLGDVFIVVAALSIGYYLFVDARRLVLWRVRRKLTLSYIFIAFVPALLIICFFVLGGLLLLFNVSAYSVRLHLDSLVDRAQLIAQSAAVDVGRATPSGMRLAIDQRRQAVAGRYPGISYAVVPAEKPCQPGTDPSRASERLTAVAGPWSHAAPPDSLPAWIPCEGFSGVIANQGNGTTQLAVRGVAWIPTRPGLAVIVDVPMSRPMLDEIGNDIGIRLGGVTITDAGEAAEDKPRAGARIRIDRPIVDEGIGRADGLTGLVWIAFLDHINWMNGRTGTVLVSFSVSPTAVYEHISGTPLQDLGNFTWGQVILILMTAVGVLFLIIQLVAVGMGLALARSITGAVHELFEGTERVGRGDFGHKIVIHSRDQLGELAASFNSMTTSIEYLLQEKAVKERLEQELQIARSIQMSLLPQGPLQVPGIDLVPHCEPAREVGGDYYDYVPIDRDRIGLLIADVSGKGTSAALYMAELKGIILSLSQRHDSPRQLLINANQIISRHLDTRSFITITYAILDLQARTLTYARAGHCPLIHVPGPHAASRAAQILVPDGMVLGLQLDDGQMFERALQESTIQLGAGDLFLFYTDGLSETMNPDGECFGDVRLGQLVERHADLPATEIRERVLREVQAFAGTADQQDDMTMLLLGSQDVPQPAERPAGALLVS